MIPRRSNMHQWSPAEKAIWEAAQVVESMAADTRLTDAVVLLQQARDKVADYVDGRCSRCGNLIPGFRPPDESGTTAGYYLARAWPKYANPGDVYICDPCMWADPVYIVDYSR